MNTRFLAVTVIRLVIGPVFAIWGFLEILFIGFNPLYLLMMLVGFAGVFHDLSSEGPLFGGAKVLLMLVRAKDIEEYEEHAERKREADAS